MRLRHDGPMGIEYVDFHFDVMCPWAYQTSRWIREVRDLNGLEVRWRFFSLEEINRVEGKKHPWEREWSYGWSMMRIGALLQREDEALLDAWYERAGRALLEEGRQPLGVPAAVCLDPDGVVAPLVGPGRLGDPAGHPQRLAGPRGRDDKGQRPVDAVVQRSPQPGARQVGLG